MYDLPGHRYITAPVKSCLYDLPGHGHIIDPVKSCLYDLPGHKHIVAPVKSCLYDLPGHRHSRKVYQFFVRYTCYYLLYTLHNIHMYMPIQYVRFAMVRGIEKKNGWSLSVPEWAKTGCLCA